MFTAAAISTEAEYEEHATRRDYLWNTLGTAVLGLRVSPAHHCPRSLGAEEAGKFSIAFVTGTLIMIACNYGVRNFQVSDIDEKTSFASYQPQPLAFRSARPQAAASCTAAPAGYDAQMATISLGVHLYKVIASPACTKAACSRAVPPGRHEPNAALRRRHRGQRGAVPHAQHAHRGRHGHRRDRLARAGHRAACLLETGKIAPRSLREVGHLFGPVRPALWVQLFLFNNIESMPKFVMEGMLLKQISAVL